MDSNSGQRKIMEIDTGNSLHIDVLNNIVVFFLDKWFKYLRRDLKFYILFRKDIF